MWRLNDVRPVFAAALFSFGALSAGQGPADLTAYAPGYAGVIFTRVDGLRCRAQRSGYGDGGKLVLLGKDGSARVLTSDFDSAADPAVSFDAKHILFAAKRAPADTWNIFEMAADGSGIRQITRNLGNCRKPMYQSALFYLNDARPSYQITFVTDAGREMNESGGETATNLYSIRFDGSLLRRLTYGISASYDPYQMEDGRILFSEWQAGRIDLFAIHLDGTDYAAFSGLQGRRVKHMACTTTKRMVVFVESDRTSPDGSGSLGLLSLRRNLHSYRALTTPADGAFLSPSPLPDGSILVSRRPATGTGSYSIDRVDIATGRRTLVYEDAGVNAIQAVALAARLEPDGHSSVVEDDQNWSKLYCLSVYENDLKREWMPPGTARRIRVIEGDASGSARKRLLGDLEIDEDGSFHLLVPPNTPIQVQIEDADGMALRASSWFWTKNKENRGCIGCHEDGERTPDNVFAKALGHPAANLMLPPERRRTVDFVHDIQPLLASKCSGGACHGGRVSPKLAASRPGQAYRELVARRFVDAGRARTSRLVWAIFGRNTSRPWDRSTAAPVPARMPPRGSTPLTDDERRAIVEWIDLGAQLNAASPGGQP
jgi:Tol biopolymer transport system component